MRRRPPKHVRQAHPRLALHEEFNCLGYYGFGIGASLHRREGPPQPGQPAACTVCPISGQCWTKHRARTKQLLPALSEIVDNLSAAGLRGPELVRAYMSKLREAKPDLEESQCVPPDFLVMASNITDGSFIAAGEKPPDRGPLTLPYPFES